MAAELTSDRPLADQVALVTGAGKGIGGALTLGCYEPACISIVSPFTQARRSEGVGLRSAPIV